MLHHTLTLQRIISCNSFEGSFLSNHYSAHLYKELDWPPQSLDLTQYYQTQFHNCWFISLTPSCFQESEHAHKTTNQTTPFMQISPLLTPIREVAGCCFQHPSMQHLRHCCSLMGNYKATRLVCLTALCLYAHDPGVTSESVGNHLCVLSLDLYQRRSTVQLHRGGRTHPTFISSQWGQLTYERETCLPGQHMAQWIVGLHFSLMWHDLSCCHADYEVFEYVFILEGEGQDSLDLEFCVLRSYMLVYS